MSEDMKEISRRELLALALPFGSMKVDAVRCSLCNICVAACSAGALAARADGDRQQLLFRQSLCNGCGECASICPEKCIEVEKTLDGGENESSPALLVEDKPVRCRQCGQPVGPESMLRKLAKKLSEAGGKLSDIDLCPACKVTTRSWR